MDLKAKYNVFDPSGLGSRNDSQMSVFAYDDGSLKPESVAKANIRAWYGNLPEY